MVSVAQSVTFWGAALAYAAATIAVFASIGLRREGALGVAVALATVGTVIHAIALGARWLEAGHFPYVGNYEGVLFGTFLVAVGYVLLCRMRPGMAPTGVLVLPAVLVTMGYGVTQATPETAVPVVYQSVWLGIHFAFAWTTYAVYILAAGIAVGVLLRDRAERRGQTEPALSDWLAPTERLDQTSVRLVAFGFLLNAVTIASGSIWAYRLWGSYWSWDPVETWTLATWIAYGFYLHARLTLRWNRRRLAWVAIVALVGVTMATWGVQIVPTSYHLFRDLGGTMTESRPQ